MWFPLLTDALPPALAILGVALILMLIAELACRIADARNVAWEVVVDWEGDRYTHREKSEPAAREWASCYPAAAAVRIHEVRHGARQLVAARWAPV